MELLQDDTFPYYSYIVFGDNCELKNIRLTSGNHHVTYYEYLLQDISGNAQQMGRCLSNEKMDELYSLLVKFTDASAEQKARHIEEVRAKHYPIIQPDGTWTCPQCGGRLVPRVARQGSGAGKHFGAVRTIQSAISSIMNSLLTHRKTGAPFAQFSAKCANFLIQNHG